MDEKEFRNEIYKWLFNEFKINTGKITTEQKKSIKKIISDYNPQSIKIEVKEIEKVASEWKPYPNTE